MGSLEQKPNARPIDVLKIAEPQRFLLDAFEAVGLTPEIVGETLLDVMQNKKSMQRVEAARLFIESTIGRAPSSSQNQHLHLHGKTQDKFFDENEFSKIPPTKTGDS